MNFQLSEDQQLMRDTFARFLNEQSSMVRVRAALPSGFDPALWAGLAELGAFSLRVPEEAGGMGLGLLDAAVSDGGSRPHACVRPDRRNARRRSTARDVRLRRSRRELLERVHRRSGGRHDRLARRRRRTGAVGCGRSGRRSRHRSRWRSNRAARDSRERAQELSPISPRRRLPSYVLAARNTTVLSADAAGAQERLRRPSRNGSC